MEQPPRSPWPINQPGACGRQAGTPWTHPMSPDARREATSDGAPPIELIDGEELHRLLKQLRVGVVTEAVERIVVQPDVLAKT